MMETVLDHPQYSVYPNWHLGGDFGVVGLRLASRADIHQKHLPRCQFGCVECWGWSKTVTIILVYWVVGCLVQTRGPEDEWARFYEDFCYFSGFFHV